ncbi:nitroreductase/quinone reductase family protein [Georgenia yuyongxinii]|uniref:DUF385 domain-containing protein n=1 Tax=Georgenia yuyongxinii TaxID=2589797 RepID=A0A552WNL6_9MICO|nr:nitroreductase/quinone reductase family protein [Georgenia yuyongxinii]TRW44093.1 DUF385 domain-containing protein [Georgenia yuyongxinii]
MTTADRAQVATGAGRAPGFLSPVHYAERTRYRRPPRGYLRLQWLGPLLTRLGLSPGYVVTLEVPGRRSGLIRCTTLARASWHGRQYLVALAGESEWVRNVRAAGGRVVLARGGRRRGATLVELAAAERAPVIRAYMLRPGRRPGSRAVAKEARYVFGVGPDASEPEIAAVAEHYPVFEIRYVGAQSAVSRTRGRP